MAKDEPAGEYEFKLPDFDEDQFIHREMVSFKTTSILFVWGIVAAAVSWAAYSMRGGDANTGWLLGLIICAVSGFALKWLFPKFGADISHFKRREWTGTGFMFFFTWLAFFMVAINPPISDFAGPQVILGADPPIQLTNGTVSLSMLAIDNDRVAEHHLEITRAGDSNLIAAPVSGGSGGVQWTNVTLPNGHYIAAGIATDGHGHTTTTKVHFNVTTPGGDFRIELPQPAVLSATSSIRVHVGAFPPCDGANYGRHPCLRTVGLHLANGNVVAMDADGERPGDWKTDANSKGWSRGVNNFTVEAQFLNHFEGAHSIPGGRIVLPTTYSVDVTVDAGSHEAGVPGDLSSRQLVVPHLEVAALLVVLLVGAIIARRHR
ncbi:MAG: hypothetical protein V4510_08085 [bacterium]